jgi:hypothetical protein
MSLSIFVDRILMRKERKRNRNKKRRREEEKLVSPM